MRVLGLCGREAGSEGGVPSLLRAQEEAGQNGQTAPVPGIW